MPTSSSSSSAGQGADVGEPGGGGVEPPRVVGQPQRRPDVGLVRVVAGEPARRRRAGSRRGARARRSSTPSRAARSATCSRPRRGSRSGRPRAAASPPPASRRRASSTSCASAAARIASRSATSPVDICTALNATTPVPASIASASRAGGTVCTSSPGWTMNGKSVEVNSISGTITRVPAGSDAATSPTRPETVEPIATRSADGRPPAARTPRGRGRCPRSSPPSSCARAATRRARAAARPTPAAAAGRSWRCSGRCPQRRRGRGRRRSRSETRRMPHGVAR